MQQNKNLRSFNLNTLPILREILVQGSVSKAAAALNVSQPALSSALKQLRHHFGDDLVIRSGSRMKLTAKGEQLIAPLENAIQILHDLVGLENGGIRYTGIRIASTDHFIGKFGPHLARLLYDAPPEYRPQFLYAGQHTPAQLMSGEIDIIVAPKETIAPTAPKSNMIDNIAVETLVTERMVAIGRADDPRLAAPLTQQQYLDWPHVSISMDPENAISFERLHLASNGLTQNDVLRVPSYLALPGIVSATGFLALLPESAATPAARWFGLKVFVPPVEFPPLELVILWHKRDNGSTRLREFRNLLKLCVSY